MAKKSGTNSTLYALLIGIDCYLPNRLPGGGYYPNLFGCVQDINRVEEFLKKRLKCPGDHMIKLTASNTGAPEPTEPTELWPTYKIIVDALRRLTDAARSGDQVYIHYSGHGGRIPTKLPKIKGVNGLDEVIVPTDIGQSSARYVRDIELAYILKKMVDKGIIPSIVIDSCHSGGMSRGNSSVAVRGIDSIDTTPRPVESLVASDDELAETWRSLSGSTTRNVALGSGWFPNPKGYALLAACRTNESAFEYDFDGKGKSGVLTYWMLDSLKDIGPDLTYKLLHNRILAKVRSQFALQTPQLEGEGGRLVFAAEHIQSNHAAIVMKINAAKQQVLLGAGLAQGVEKGAIFAIYPRKVRDFAQTNKRIALVRTARPGVTDSWAKIISLFNGNSIEQGDHALMTAAGDVRLLRTVSLTRSDKSISARKQESAFNRVEELLAGDSNGFLRLASIKGPADYQVVIAEDESFMICDASGQPFANMSPGINIKESNAPARLVQRLVHLAKYHNVLRLYNNDLTSSLARKLVIDAVGARSKRDSEDGIRRRPFRTTGALVIKDGKRISLRIRNNSSQVLNIAVLDLQPDWGITQIYPSGDGAYSCTFDPGQEEALSLRANLPRSYLWGRDVIKVFGTFGAANFRWLELPSLDQISIRSAALNSVPANPLEELFAAVASDARRNLKPDIHPNIDWVTDQIEITIVRNAMNGFTTTRKIVT